MAQKTVVTLVDDITGEEVEEGGRTIEIGWLGKTYELDVSSGTFEGLEEYFNDVLHNARQVTRGGRRSTASTGSKKSKGERIQRVREWARGQGMEVADRGRINKDVLEAYNDANPQDAAEAA